jgi:hypothetical protein
MSAQEDYDQGYEDGRRSRDVMFAMSEAACQQARQDLDCEREESARLRAIIHRPRIGEPSESLPF